jgi:hypothetical protein
VELLVENRGGEHWPPAGREPRILLGHHWLNHSGAALGEVRRTGFTETVEPGATTRVQLPLRAPAWGGSHQLEVDVVHEGVRWFGCAARAAVEVEPAVDRLALGSPPGRSEDGYAAEIVPSATEVELAIGAREGVAVRMRNTGSRRWEAGDGADPPVRATCRWIAENGTVVITDGPRTELPEPVASGEAVELEVGVAVPTRPGRYTMEIDLVAEGLRWFGEPGLIRGEALAPPIKRYRFSRAKLAGRGPVARARRRANRSIPRVIHRIWLGDAPLPDEFRHFGETWARHHPGWELRLWTEADAARLLPSRWRRACRSLSEASNLLRYQILARVGGIYADTDVECKRSLEPLLDGVRGFAGWERAYQVGTALLGSVPGHRVFQRAAREARITAGTGHNSVAGTGPEFFTQLVAEDPSLTVFAPEYFYPYLWDEPQRRHEEFPDAFAVHHWTLSWKKDAP